MCLEFAHKNLKFGDFRIIKRKLNHFWFYNFAVFLFIFCLETGSDEQPTKPGMDNYSAGNARIASAVLATAIPSVCLSVRL